MYARCAWESSNVFLAGGSNEEQSFHICKWDIGVVSWINKKLGNIFQLWFSYTVCGWINRLVFSCLEIIVINLLISVAFLLHGRFNITLLFNNQHTENLLTLIAYNTMHAFLWYATCENMLFSSVSDDCWLQDVTYDFLYAIHCQALDNYEES